MTRIGLLAPMPSERAPLVKTLGLAKGEVGGAVAYTGVVSGVDAVVMETGIGFDGAIATTELMLEVADVEHVMVVGVCGGVDPDLRVGDLLVPEVVVDLESGKEYTPHHLGTTEPRGRLASNDELLLGEEVVTRLLTDGVTGIDMETSAVARVCEGAGVPWSVFRSPSDHADEGLIDAAVAAMANPDGSPNTGAIIRYVVPKPWRMRKLARLGRDLKSATTTVSRAAKDAIERTGRG